MNNDLFLAKVKSCVLALSYVLVMITSTVWGQSLPMNEPVSFLEPELMLGKVVHNYPDHPETGIRNAFFLNIGRYTNNLNEHWANYYNQPSVGISFSYAGVGNREVFGNEFSVIPFVSINTSRRKYSDWHFKFGLGASYFTRFYDAETNAENEVIGSSFTWTFQLFLYKTIVKSELMNMKFGGGYLHSSNAHTQLPNFGLNSAILSISTQFFTHPIDITKRSTNTDFQADRTLHYFISTRYGYGWHEYGSTTGPVGGPKRAVHSYMLTGGIIFRQHIKVRSGLTYRFYEHYYDDIIENQHPQYIENPEWNASNIYFLLGAEFLIGHIGMDIEGGINLHKPFFKDFFEAYERGSDFDYWLKKTFPSRLGINYYLINTNKKPEHNIYLGAHINANFGQADFAEIGIGYSYLLK